MCDRGLLACRSWKRAGADAGRHNSSEARFQLDVKVNDAALAAYLPPGWTPNVAAQGAAKDCNLRVIFIDRVTVNAPDGQACRRGSSRLGLPGGAGQ